MKTGDRVLFRYRWEEETLFEGYGTICQPCNFDTDKQDYPLRTPISLKHINFIGDCYASKEFDTFFVRLGHIMKKI